MKQKLLEAAVYICIGITVALEMKRLVYATEMFAYTEAAIVFLCISVILSLLRFIDE